MPKKSKKTKSKPKKAKKVNPIPKGFRSVTPYLSIEGAAEALEWYKKGLGAKELYREAMPDGKIMHARIRIGDSLIMLSDYMPGGPSKSPKSLGGTPTTLHVYSKNVDKLFQQAVEAGAKVLMELDNQFWGERYGQLEDPFGHHWSLSMIVPMTAKEKKEKQEQAMAMMSRGEHPSREEQQQAPMAQQ